MELSVLGVALFRFVVILICDRRYCAFWRSSGTRTTEAEEATQIPGRHGGAAGDQEVPEIP